MLKDPGSRYHQFKEVGLAREQARRMLLDREYLDELEVAFLERIAQRPDDQLPIWDQKILDSLAEYHQKIHSKVKVIYDFHAEFLCADSNKKFLLLHYWNKSLRDLTEMVILHYQTRKRPDLVERLTSVREQVRLHMRQTLNL